MHVLLCGVREEFASLLERAGLRQDLGDDVFLEQPVRQTSTMLAVRRAYELIPGPCDTCPNRQTLARVPTSVA